MTGPSDGGGLSKTVWLGAAAAIVAATKRHADARIGKSERTAVR